MRKKFQDLKEYHFSQAPRNLWTKKDGTKNFELARGATGELVETLKERYGWNDEEVRENIGVEHFHKEPIRYNKTLSGMLQLVYGTSPSAAIEDYFKHKAHGDDILEQAHFKKSEQPIPENELRAYEFSAYTRDEFGDENEISIILARNLTEALAIYTENVIDPDEEHARVIERIEEKPLEKGLLTKVAYEECEL